MALRSGAAIRPSEHNQHRQSQPQKQRIPERHLNTANDDDDEEKPLVRKRHRTVNSSPSASHPISAAVEIHRSIPAVTNAAPPIPQQTMMSKFKLPPPTRSVQQRMSQSSDPYFRQHPIPLVQRDQSTSFNPSHTSHTSVYDPLQSDMSPKASASLPLQPAPSRSTPKDPRARFAPQEQKYTAGLWRDAKNRALKDWLTADNNYARTRDVQLAKMSGGVSGVYNEAAAFVREKLPYLSEMDFSGSLARKRAEYMTKKVREVLQKITSTGSGTRDGIALYEQREALFPGFHQLWEVMKHDRRFKEIPTLESVVDRAPESDESQDIWDDAELVEDYGTSDGAEGIASGGRSSKASKPDVAASVNRLIDTASSTLGTQDISLYFQTRIRELEDKCEKWQEKYEKLRDEHCELKYGWYLTIRSTI
ncbi:hypothetical protein BG015_000872 [Linnemannia schmuckeri]|uniref:Uncharacterized protein n=1 Tax=Linnemannia schmuckeri TaxID=64567 RepID=A0A9P5VDM0_9FUNG|nr:hypothetical protein BG015_000872 [Linnemannia schmuckeri]